MKPALWASCFVRKGGWWFLGAVSLMVEKRVAIRAALARRGEMLRLEHCVDRRGLRGWAGQEGQRFQGTDIDS